jgi:hypothetical protein
MKSNSKHFIKSHNSFLFRICKVVYELSIKTNSIGLPLELRIWIPKGI